MYKTALARQRRNKRIYKKILKYFVSKKIEKMSFKFAAAVLLVAMNVVMFNAPVTNAFYNDTEGATDNAFQAAMLDFILTNNNLDKIIGPEALGEISHASVAMPEDSSLTMQYALNTLIATTTSDASFCDGLTVEAKDNGITKYLGPLSGLWSATTTEFGTWEFRFDLPPNISVPHGVQCNANAVFSAWREDILDPIGGGWHDEETLNISFTARMVVLNEIYARPADVAVAPKDREYIELYNNGSTPIDILGWQISEISGDTEKFYTIVGSATTTSEMQPFNGSTIIPANGFLVLVYKNAGAEYLNNTGDTVKLYQNNILLDSHTYPSVAIGKAVVRFPDGIGFWVDPEATPGTTNTVSIDDLRAAGFDDAMIAEVIEMALIKNSTILERAVTMTLNEELDIATTTADIATTTPEILTASTTDTIITTTETTTSETVTLPPFKEEEMVVVENATTTEDMIGEPTDTITLEIITEPEVTTEPESVIEEPAATEPVVEVVVEVVSEPVVEVAPVVETPVPAEPII